MVPLPNKPCWTGECPGAGCAGCRVWGGPGLLGQSRRHIPEFGDCALTPSGWTTEDPTETLNTIPKAVGGPHMVHLAPDYDLFLAMVITVLMDPLWNMAPLWCWRPCCTWACSRTSVDQKSGHKSHHTHTSVHFKSFLSEIRQTLAGSILLGTEAWEGMLGEYLPCLKLTQPDHTKKYANHS